MAETADIEDVLAANASFYDAFERRSLESMGQVWEHSQRVVCTHPGWPILRGWQMVMDSWRRIFDGPGRSQFIVTNDVAVAVGDVAWVTLDENLVDRAATGTIAATNVFVRTSDSWKLVLHHGSPVRG
jgi:ketosteroid isomerase-like protein